MALRDELLRLLRLALPRHAALTAFAHRLEPALVTSSIVELPAQRTRALAEKLVDATLAQRRLPQLLDALLAHSPDLAGEIAAVRLRATEDEAPSPRADGKVKRNPFLPARLQQWLGLGGASDARDGRDQAAWPELTDEETPGWASGGDADDVAPAQQDKPRPMFEQVADQGLLGSFRWPFGKSAQPLRRQQPPEREPSSEGLPPGLVVGGPQAKRDAGHAPAGVAKGFDVSSPAPTVSAVPAAQAPPASAAAERGVVEPSLAGAPYVEPQIVCLGFSTTERPDAPIIDRTLAANHRYLLWVEIGPEYIAGSLQDADPIAGIREGDELDVILFPFPDQLGLDDHRHGRVRIHSAGNRVLQRAWPDTPTAIAELTLCFAVTTPPRPGRYALRCNVYCRGVLLQSHLVSAEVTDGARERFHSLRRSVDYNLTSRLDSGLVSPADDCRISILINDDGHGTHSFRFVSSKDGVPERIGDAHVEGAQLAKMVRFAREALRWTAWGTTEPWTDADTCKFTAGVDAKQLGDGLLLMARRGASLWMQVAASFAFVGPEALELREHMRAPGRVQIALRDSPDSVIPVALIYDYPFDAGRSDVVLCDAALAAITAGRALADEPCFLGRCPHYADRGVVCPGGFWGFRHDLGLPLHLPRGEVASVIPRDAAVRAFAPISTDPKFALRDGHLAQLGTLSDGWMEILRDRAACLERLKEPRQLIYFYCHGGVLSSETPFLQVGETTSDPILAESLVDAGVTWPEPMRPLVILNGCHTTATSPDAMFSMLTAFASHCNAAGVIGTEITNFEPIAGVVGRELLTRFLAGEPLGRALRLARLELLRSGNPLGLMYIPFALPGLRLS